MRIRVFFKFWLFLFVLCSCGHKSKHDATFNRIDQLCDSVPEQAIQALDSIDRTSFSESDRYRFDLLTIKSRDKAYIAHTSDSLILDVIDYYANHRKEGLYAEALYYGGRVYSDLGDLPTALEFFQKSLDEIPKDNEHSLFRCIVLNQTGRLMHNLKLDSEAIKYLEESLKLADPDKESCGIAFTHTILAGSLRKLNKFKLARNHINEAVSLSSKLDRSDRETIQEEYAYMLYREGKIDSALTVIRPLASKVDSITTPFSLAVAAEIYKDAGILDTAYMYARKLTKLKTTENKKTGYKVIFSDELKDYVSKDTLMKLLPEYNQAIEDFMNHHEAEQAIIQNSRFNYNLHIKQRDEVEKRLHSIQKILWIAGCALLIILLISTSIIFRRKYRKSKNDSQIMEGILLADKLKEQSSLSFPDEVNDNIIPRISTDPLQEKQRILEEIKLAKEQNPSESVDKKLKESSLYKNLKEKAENKRVMGKDVTWRMIDELIESVSPGFENRLIILTQSKITPSERKVAYLMKFGFTQIQMASLLAKEASTISAQRSSLAKKIGFEKSAIAAIIVRL